MDHMLTILIVLLSVCHGVKEWTLGETVARQIGKESDENARGYVQKEGSALKPLKMVRQATRITAHAGQTVHLLCDYLLKKTSGMNFLWKIGSAVVLHFIDGKIVKPKNRVELVGDGSKGNASITISNVTVQDAGVYICTLTTLHDMKDHECEVNITVLAAEQPSTPTSPSPIITTIIPDARKCWGLLPVIILILFLLAVGVAVVGHEKRAQRRRENMEIEL
uniref:hepatitis A virus cellular receptor 2 homolog n=1 Tax=Myxine glutinosa TaxID=7769 RepID=UPI00358FB3F7